MITEKKLTTLDRVRLDLEVLDKLKEQAKKLPEDLKDMSEINIIFGHVRHSLENEIRHLMIELEEVYQQAEGLRRMNTALLENSVTSNYEVI